MAIELRDRVSRDTPQGRTQGRSGEQATHAEPALRLLGG